jgi:hypothetical protein
MYQKIAADVHRFALTLKRFYVVVDHDLKTRSKRSEIGVVKQELRFGLGDFLFYVWHGNSQKIFLKRLYHRKNSPFRFPKATLSKQKKTKKIT